jgi:polyphosphate kinase 2 (PPK2 family)
MGKPAENNGKLSAKAYEKELRKLQAKLCKLQDWVRHNGMRVVIVFDVREVGLM